MAPLFSQKQPIHQIYRNPGRPSKAPTAEWETRLDFLASTHEPCVESTSASRLPPDLGSRLSAGL